MNKNTCLKPICGAALAAGWFSAAQPASASDNAESERMHNTVKLVQCYRPKMVETFVQFAAENGITIRNDIEEMGLRRRGVHAFLGVALQALDNVAGYKESLVETFDSCVAKVGADENAKIPHRESEADAYAAFMDERFSWDTAMEGMKEASAEMAARGYIAVYDTECGIGSGAAP